MVQKVQQSSANLETGGSIPGSSSHMSVSSVLGRFKIQNSCMKERMSFLLHSPCHKIDKAEEEESQSRHQPHTWFCLLNVLESIFLGCFLKVKPS